MPESARLRVSDPLSDVLSALNLRASIFVRTEAAAPWAISFPRGDARFHVVERGDLIATVSGIKKPIRAGAGDLLIFPHGEHTIADKPGRRAVELETVAKKCWDADAGALRVGSRGGPDTRLICGAYKLERIGRDAFLSVLPPVLHVRGRSDRPSGPLDLVMQIFIAEAHGTEAGSALCAARLVDMILVHAIRDWLAKEPATVGGWLGAMRDPHVGAALSRLHDAPAYPWTVEELSERVGLSRSPLAARFTALVGEPPLRYLTRWRMQLASQLLRRGVSVRETAERVGYESEAAFSRTFKKYMGKAPVKYRTRSRPDEA
jgi:AraC-like DNA-binding protein